MTAPFIKNVSDHEGATVVALTDGSRVHLQGDATALVEAVIHSKRSLLVHQPDMRIVINPEHIIAAAFTEREEE
ncbi:MAG TPA: hypothetical protein VJY40_01135 [Corynebacterium sp.]|nr:hypothetical protein [Corynebacterium sp.]